MGGLEHKLKEGGHDAPFFRLQLRTYRTRIHSMYVKIAHQLGKEAGRAAPARALFGLLPHAKHPVIREIQQATDQALTGAFLGEMSADLIQKEKAQGHAALVGATTALGHLYGTQYLPRLLFSKTPTPKLSPRQIWASRGLGATAGAVAGLLALQGLKYLKSRRKTEDQK